MNTASKIALGLAAAALGLSGAASAATLDLNWHSTTEGDDTITAVLTGSYLDSNRFQVTGITGTDSFYYSGNGTIDGLDTQDGWNNIIYGTGNIVDGSGLAFYLSNFGGDPYPGLAPYGTRFYSTGPNDYSVSVYNGEGIFTTDAVSLSGFAPPSPKAPAPLAGNGLMAAIAALVGLLVVRLQSRKQATR